MSELLNCEVSISTDNQLKTIETWLKQEKVQRGESFFYNFSIIEKAHTQSKLAVLVIDSAVVGFSTLWSSGNIVAIHHDHRGKGYGRKLSHWRDNWYLSQGMSVLEIECTPQDSAPFWKAMGYILRESSGLRSRIIGYKEFPQIFVLPEGDLASFEISFSNQRRNYDKSVQPFRKYKGVGVITHDSRFHLPERAICYTPEMDDLYDCIAIIKINENIIYNDKLKRREGELLGFKRDKGGTYYIDFLNLEAENNI